MAEQFMEMTGCKDSALAEFYLSSAAGDVNAAVNLYFESIKGSSKIATLSGKTKESTTYFAGGEKSGVLLQGKEDKSRDIVNDIVNLASQSKASDDESFGNSGFTGSGFKLGATGSKSTVQEKIVQEDQASRTLNFWRNGFSIDDGPLRDFNDPENEAFLNAIKNGTAPIQYLNVKPGQRVELKVAHRSNEDFTPPPKEPMKAFSGHGQRLGSIVPNAPSLSAKVSSPVKFELNQNEPQTSIQIRLGDGTRLVLKCNHSHTVGDLRDFIVSSRPGESSRSWILQTGHPVSVLNNFNQTVKDANLLNSVVIQRYQ